MKIAFSLGGLLLSGVLLAQSPRVAIIPQPVSVVEQNGEFRLPAQLSVQVPDNPQLKETMMLLQERLSLPTGYQVSVSSSASAAAIRLQLHQKPAEVLGDEGYTLEVNASGVSIFANKPAGLYYGVQSLLQLLPKEIESGKLVSGISWTIPYVSITDYPRFPWRGLMFDVSRHFFTKQEVKDYIDKMARYKYNVFHWHLTDDEGWRLEIKSLPRLTEVGSKRVEKVGYFGDMTKPAPNEPRTSGGFYTQDDIREIIDYASARFVNILPEIDVPGHSLAAVVAYPELSCTPGADKYVVRSGEKIIDWFGNGKFSALVDNSLCPANEKVYTFLDKVFGEVAALFPFDYIHIGGDECAHNFWEKTPAILQLMKKENLKNMHEVQSYFTRRVVKMVSAKGKKVIGWDEILEGGLADGAAVMSWRGEKGGIEAAKLKHDVVMSPTTYCYIDYMQGDAAMEPKVYATLRLNKAYAFNPVPAGADARYIKGGQSNLWTEQVYNMRHAQYMTWPRGLATIESVWSPDEAKNWKNFVERVEVHTARMDVQQVKYATSFYEPYFTASKAADGSLMVQIHTELDNVSVHYTFDNSFPDQFYPAYKGAVKVPVDASMLRAVSYRGNEQKGRILTIAVDELKKRAGITK